MAGGLQWTHSAAISDRCQDFTFVFCFSSPGSWMAWASSAYSLFHDSLSSNPLSPLFLLYFLSSISFFLFCPLVYFSAVSFLSLHLCFCPPPIHFIGPSISSSLSVLFVCYCSSHKHTRIRNESQGLNTSYLSCSTGHPPPHSPPRHTYTCTTHTNTLLSQIDH